VERCVFDWWKNVETPECRPALRDGTVPVSETEPYSWIFPGSRNPGQPMGRHQVCDYLHSAARAVGLDFEGLGPHSFRRANITWGQQVGGSAIEASKIAGHAEVQMTSEYTFVALERQQELTRAIQGRLRAAAEKVEHQPKQQEQSASDPGAGQPADDFERFMWGLIGEDNGEQR